MIIQNWDFTMRCTDAPMMPAKNASAYFYLSKAVVSEDRKHATIEHQGIRLMGCIAAEFKAGRVYRVVIEEVPDVSDPEYAPNSHEDFQADA